MSHAHPPGAQPPGPQPLPGIDSIVAVGSGKGGVGKTTIAVNLALALARMGHKVGLLDADVYGPNVPLMMNATAHARKAIEMFRQVKVEILGMVENMSHFICPHCHNEIDIFSKGGAERTATQFGVPFLGRVELDPSIREGGDTGRPVTLAGEDAPHSKAFFDIARGVVERIQAIKAAPSQDVVQII